ncbi:MAG: sulfatase-like hydrolase/transferase [Spirochaetes bacterium]|nr:sulfatase-like hydrolase/transferase [Spirochaetota bacterium]
MLHIIIPEKKILTIILKVFICIFLLFIVVKDFNETNQYYLNTSAIEYIFFIIAWISSILLFIILIIGEKTFFKKILIIVFLTSYLLVDICYSTLNTTLTAETISLFWNERSYFDEALFTYWNILIFPFARFLILIIITFSAIDKFIKLRINNKILIILIIIPFTTIFILSSKPNGKGIDGLPPHFAPIPFTSHLAIVHIQYKKIKRKEVDIPINHHFDIKNIVLIIDESIRGDFIDLNYNRKTTPYLIMIKNKIINYGLAISSYNRSNGSNAILRMGISLQDLISKEGHKILFSNPFIWQYAKNAGFKTIYIDSQKLQFQNYMDENEIKYIDLIIRPNFNSQEDTDHQAANILKKLLQQPEKKFIILVKAGCHFPYESRYPKSERIFSPVMTFGLPTNDRLKLINSYRNAIRWSVNNFFQILISNISLKDTVIFYTSDHGQNLFDEGTNDINLRHGTNKNSKVQEVIVPMMILTENKNFIQLSRKSLFINFNKTTHFNIFPTILYLMGYNKTAISSKYNATLFDTNDTPLGFFNGNLRFGIRKFNKIDYDLTKYIDKEIDILIKGN